MNKDRAKGKVKDVAGRVERQVGEWTDDKRNGQGVFYSATGSIKQSGIWKDNEFVGAVAR